MVNDRFTYEQIYCRGGAIARQKPPSDEGGFYPLWPHFLRPPLPKGEARAGSTRQAISCLSRCTSSTAIGWVARPVALIRIPPTTVGEGQDPPLQQVYSYVERVKGIPLHEGGLPLSGLTLFGHLSLWERQGRSLSAPTRRPNDICCRGGIALPLTAFHWNYSHVMDICPQRKTFQKQKIIPVLVYINITIIHNRTSVSGQLCTLSTGLSTSVQRKTLGFRGFFSFFDKKIHRQFLVCGSNFGLQNYLQYCTLAEKTRSSLPSVIRWAATCTAPLSRASQVIFRVWPSLASDR